MDFLKTAIINKIKEYEKISLFFHEVPDFDALGACYALKRYIRDVSPEKEVAIIGLDVLDESFAKGFFSFDKRHVPNEFLSQSLGIILDTANEQRIWTSRHKYCKELIRIDHHPQVESIAQIEWIDANYPATCEMVGELLYFWDPKYVLSPTATYLYAGIVTDTNRFLYLNTKPSTFQLASKLLDTSFDRQRINDAIYLKSLKEAKFDSYVMRQVKFFKELKFAYAILAKDSFEKYGIELRMSMVHVLNNIKGLEIWMTIYYDDTIKAWRGSLRSRNLPINQIAEKYNGGGHKLAAGFTLKNLGQAKKMRADIIDYLKQVLQHD
ncbi:MAG: bifunctional oligoribonuclease/PAP phosphatase NrnA [Mycoplasmataceae bacterium]|nr:bifunctional oligoribonuclease/PAP phosphatase NrnA [Mycoplasmataceae bacterium]